MTKKNNQTHPDLFEDGETPVGQPAHGWVQQKKRRLGYRPAKEGEVRCKDCEHLIKQSYHGKNYYKCELIGISRAESTDVRLKDTCNKNSERDD